MDEPLNDHQRLALEGLERMLREHQKAIGARLVRECLRLGFTQQSASEAVGCARRTWFSYESGATMPDALMLHRLDLLGFDVLFIVTGRDSRARRDV